MLKIMIKISLRVIALLIISGCAGTPKPEINTGTREIAYQYYMRALSLTDSARFEQALEQLDRAIAINHHIASFFILQGEIHEKTGQYDPAIISFQNALNLRANEPQSLEKIARLYSRKKDFQSASAFLRKAYAQNPSKIDWLLLIAEYELDLNSVGRAYNYLQQYKAQATKTGTFSGRYYCLLGRYEHKNKHFELAEPAFRECCMQEMADSTDVRYYLQTCFKLGRTEEAYRILSGIGNKLLKPVDTIYFKGLYYFHSNNLNDARKQLEQAARFGYPDAELYYYLGKIYMRAGEHVKAREMFTRFRQLSDDIQLIESLEHDEVKANK